MQRILIIGATSAIAEATARLWAERGDALYLLARDDAHLKLVATDLSIRGAAQVETAQLDVSNFDLHTSSIEQAFAALGTVDIALLAHGAAANEKACAQSTDTLRAAFDVNATATLSLMSTLARHFETQGHGTLAVISSVAGDRGRASNLVYGSAKAAVSAYASGLRQRLHQHGVHVLTIKPGWVDTPLTAHMQKSALFASADKVGRGIVRAVDTHRTVVYLPWFWRPILALVRGIPTGLFQRLKW